MPNHHYTYTPRPQSRTSRRDLVAKIRRNVGTSSNVPSARRTLIAANMLAELVYLATDGKLHLELRDVSDNRIDFLTAIGAASTDPEA